MRRSLLAIIAGLFGVVVANATPASDVALLRRVADRVLDQTTCRLIDHRDGRTYTSSRDLPLSPEISIESKFNAWFYQTWLVADGMSRVGAVLADPKYQGFGARELEFIHQHLDYFSRQHAAHLKAAPVGDGSLSPIGFYFDLREPWHTALAPLVLDAVYRSGDQDDVAYVGRLKAFLAQAPRTRSGAIYRRNGRLMADDAFMIVPVLVRLFRATGERPYLEAAMAQINGYRDRLFDPARGLYVHACDARSGRSLGQFWGRANGWMLLAQVELLSALPPGEPGRAVVLEAFRRHCEGLRRVESASGGWHQLLDHPESWIESSCTGMFAYGLGRGVNEGWLDRSFAPAVLQGWRALATKVTAEGEIVDVCGSTDVGDVAFYLHRPRLMGDLDGYGPFLLAGSEVIRSAAGSAPPSS